ncbi:unnamed protein product [Nippostrongylus brasiliensis]|uniref:TIR domain-containing protein n=1 Tax=Nippostrongylus brasiliensis TaxID=27835 RepID=A0A0N4Y6D0_NIPBR|nr:unnamed protein product [Nippostrongylus brasiliensis]
MQVEVCSGKVYDRTGAVSETVVMRLMDGLLDSERRSFCDNCCHGAAKDEKVIPELTKDYNACMLFADTSDQMAAYYPFIRRTFQKIPFLQFKEDVVECLWDVEGRGVQKIRKSRVLEKMVLGLIVDTRPPLLSAGH